MSPALPWSLMIRICLLFRGENLPGAINWLCARLLVPLLIAVSTNAWAAEENPPSCGREDFQNAYYLIGVESIAAISEFFFSIPSTYRLSEDSSFIVHYGRKNRLQTYFDDNDLSLLNQQRELSLTLNQDMPKYKREREVVFYKDNSTTPAQVTNYEARRYNKKISPLDKHVILGRIQRRLRPLLIAKLESLPGVSVNNIGVGLKIEHRESVLMYRHYGNNYGAVTLDRFHLSNYGVPNTFSLLRFEIDASMQQQLQQHERDELYQVFCRASQGFQQRYPQLQLSRQFGYAEFHQLAETLLPTRMLFAKYPILYKVGQIIILALIGALFLCLFLGRYTKHKGYRAIVTGQQKANHE